MYGCDQEGGTIHTCTYSGSESSLTLLKYVINKNICTIRNIDYCLINQNIVNSSIYLKWSFCSTFLENNITFGVSSIAVSVAVFLFL